MNIYKKIITISLITLGSLTYPGSKEETIFNSSKFPFQTERKYTQNKTNPTPEDKYIGLQFPPAQQVIVVEQDAFDQYAIELLNRIILLDKEIHNNPRLKKIASLTDFLAQDNSNHLLISKGKSFGWNDPLAIISGIFSNGVAETPNEFIQTIEESKEFPGKYKAILKGTGLYVYDRSAHSKLAEYIKKGPAQISKYENLETITSLKKLNDNEFKTSVKEDLKKKIPSLQGEIICECYAHGCDFQGVVYFDQGVLTHLIQKHNGNRYKNNTTPCKIIPKEMNSTTLIKEAQTQETKELTVTENDLPSTAELNKTEKTIQLDTTPNELSSIKISEDEILSELQEEEEEEEEETTKSSQDSNSNEK